MRLFGSDENAEYYAAAIYGSIVAAALMADFHQTESPAQTAALALFSTMTVLFLAHVWSGILGKRLHSREPISLGLIWHVAKSEWPLLEATFAPLIFLAIGAADGLSNRHALNVAMAVCVIDLFAWGVILGRRMYSEWWHAVLVGAVNGLIGVGLVMLELAIVH